jgi:hypothetical protein
VRPSIVGNDAYRDLSYSALTDASVGEDLALFLGFELFDSIEFSSSVVLVCSPVHPTRDETHNVVFRFYRGLSARGTQQLGPVEVLTWTWGREG